MQIAIIGARDFTMRVEGKNKGKYPEAQDNAEEFVRGFIESLPKHTIIISGGQKLGVDGWVRKYFDLYKIKRIYKIVEHLPAHEKGAPYHVMNFFDRNKLVVRDAKDGLFAIVPEEYDWTKGGTTDVIKTCRQFHVAHTIIKLKPNGEVAEIIDVEATDTFSKEKPVVLQGSKRTGKSSGDKPYKRPRRGSKSSSAGPITLKRRQRISVKVPVSPKMDVRERRSDERRRTRSVVQRSLGGRKKGTKAKHEPIILKKKRIG